MNKIRLLLASYSFIIILLFLYSFTQVDLGLTLTKASIWQGIQTSFQHIGYFQRPLSSFLYLVLISLLFIFYGIFLYLTSKKKIGRKHIWAVIIFTAVLLTFSYTAFSYDLFNYIFDAKILTHYHQNPYLHKALDYPAEPMLSFMHWTHRVYPYGPVWLLLSIPLSYAGLNYFLITFFIFKAFLAVCYLISCLLIEKISKKINSDNSMFNLVFFALNPLVIIECLVSSHNDIAMMMLSLLGIYLLFKNEKIKSVSSVILSALIKMVTAVLLLPTLLYLFGFKIFKNPQPFILTTILASMAGFLYVASKMEIQPWYFLWIFPFIVLLKPNKFLIILSTSFSFGLLLSYSLFLYQGNWNGVLLSQKLKLIELSLVLPFFYFLLRSITSKMRARF